MSLNLVSDDDLRAALRPYRVDSVAFEAAVRERLHAVEKQHATDPLWRLSPLARAAAAMIPMEAFTGGKVVGTTSQLAPFGFVYKLFGYLMFPAICMFVLAGATIVSLMKIRKIQRGNDPVAFGGRESHQGISQWWHRNFFGVIFVFGATLYLAAIGASSTLFFLYILSMGMLLYVLSSLAKLGLGNRMAIGQSCAAGLSFLAQTAGFPSVGDNEIHFVDQLLLPPILFGGAFLLILLGTGIRTKATKSGCTPRWMICVLGIETLASLVVWLTDRTNIAFLLVAALLGTVTLILVLSRARQRFHIGLVDWTRHLILAAPIVAILSALPLAWVQSTFFRAITPTQIQGYVESFDTAPYGSASWDQWEVPARWAIESNLSPDFTKPQRLLAQEIAGEQNAYILGVAFRLGMIRADQLFLLRNYQTSRASLLDDHNHVTDKQPFLNSVQEDWIIRAAALQNDLSSDDQDDIERRLLLTIEQLPSDKYAKLETALRATELLKVIERPVDRDRFRSLIHQLLRNAHSTTGGGFQLAGGFKSFIDIPELTTGDLCSTSHAIQLMAIYGIPDGLNLDWVRSYLKTKAFRPMNDKWMAPVLLDQLNRLPGMKPSSWVQIVYYERTLLAAVILVAMCIYATLTSPVSEIHRRTEDSTKPDVGSGDLTSLNNKSIKHDPIT